MEFLWYIPNFLRDMVGNSTTRFFVFDLLWSNRPRFRLLCTSSLHICVHWYMRSFYHTHIFTVQMLLEMRTIRKTISKAILSLTFKIVVKAVSISLSLRNN